MGEAIFCIMIAVFALLALSPLALAHRDALKAFLTPTRRQVKRPWPRD